MNANPAASGSIVRGFLLALSVLAMTLTLGACATVGDGTSETAASTAGATSDPLEPLNRVVSDFNDAFDQALAQPVAKGYGKVVPYYLRDMVRNVFGNMRDVWTAFNQLLQGKPGLAASDAWRVAINTTLGFGGLIDIASDVGVPKHNEDFGQTLGRWGLPAGPYLVLPILGPSSLRDAPGRGVDIWGDPLRAIDSHGRRNNAVLARAIDGRQRLLETGDIVDQAALDRYSFIRDSWLQMRRNQVYDGEAPPLDSGDADWLDDDD